MCTGKNAETLELLCIAGENCFLKLAVSLKDKFAYLMTQESPLLSIHPTK